LSSNPTTPDYQQLISSANVYEVAEKTPLDHARRLSERTGNQVWLKREDLQPVFSFKLRGAYNRLAQLSPEEKQRGVICSSAGNHGQGVALAGSRLNIRSIMVMPTTTADIKVEAVRSFGGEVILHGNTYDDAYAHAMALSREHGHVFVHPFDDPDVIAGQGTIGKELLEQCVTAPDAVFVPVGGGGLLAGVAAWIKAHSPATRVIGVEPLESASMDAALKAGSPVTLDSVGIFADGVAVKRVGEHTFDVCRRLVDEIITVDTDATCAAIKDIFEDTRTIVEPAGALAVAGLKQYAEEHTGQQLIAINSGANINFYRLRHVAERAALGEHQEALFAVQIPEQLGAFKQFCQTIGARSVTEFNYRAGDETSASIFVGIEVSDGLTESGKLAEDFRRQNYKVVELADNELAKVHIRHMVGGLAPGLEDERLLRFIFPERPGALIDFLEEIGSNWNISLFHYRNHGADYGRVLAGIQVPDEDLTRFREHLAALDYPYWDETDNPAYRAFLAGSWPD